MRYINTYNIAAVERVRFEMLALFEKISAVTMIDTTEVFRKSGLSSYTVTFVH